MEIRYIEEIIKIIENKKIVLKLAEKRKSRSIIELERIIATIEGHKIRVLTKKEKEIWDFLIKRFKRDLMNLSLQKINKLKQWKREGILYFIANQHFNSLIKRNPLFFDDLLLEVMKKSEINTFKEKYLKRYYINSIYYYIEDWELIRKDIDYEEIKMIQKRVKSLIKLLNNYLVEIKTIESSEKTCLFITDLLHDLLSKLELIRESTFDLEEMLVMIKEENELNLENLELFTNKLIALDDEMDQIENDYKSFQTNYRKTRKEIEGTWKRYKKYTSKTSAKAEEKVILKKEYDYITKIVESNDQYILLFTQNKDKYKKKLNELQLTPNQYRILEIVFSSPYLKESIPNRMTDSKSIDSDLQILVNKKLIRYDKHYDKYHLHSLGKKIMYNTVTDKRMRELKEEHGLFWEKERKKERLGGSEAYMMVISSSEQSILEEEFIEIKILKNGNLELKLNKKGLEYFEQLDELLSEHWADVFNSIDEELECNGFNVENDYILNITTISKNKKDWIFPLDQLVHPYEILIRDKKVIIEVI